MDAHFIALAVPFFFALIALEFLINRRRGDARYELHDTLGSLSCGIGQQLLGIFFVVLEVGGYTVVFDHLRVATIAPSIGSWIVLLFALDFLYFVYHWASHRVNFLWASHAVHHQSEEYNLGTALRQSWLTSLTSWIFYLPLAIVGFPPLMFVVMHTLNTLYQFWIHTRAIGRVGVLEAFLNTPSHHRVHHGIDPRYIDKNYAGIFIVWDRLFGTFAAEDREPVYGTVKPLASFDPVWANLAPWVELARLSMATGRFVDKLRIWVAPPEWRPADLGGPVIIPEVSRETQRKFAIAAPRGLDMYVVVNFVLTTGAATLLLWYAAALPRPLLLAIVALSLATLFAVSALIEARTWAVPFEWVRLGAVVGVVAFLARGTAAAVPATVAAAVGALALGGWVSRYRGRRLARGRRNPEIRQVDQSSS